MTGSVTVERSQREEGGKVWWWIGGDTYPHRELLKQHGARWSKKRQAWYWVGAQLPNALAALAGDSPPDQPLLAIFGGHIVGKETAANGDLIVKGENGVFATRTTWINRWEKAHPVWEFDLPPRERVGDPRTGAESALQAAHAQYSLYTRRWHIEAADTLAALDALAATVPFTSAPTPADPAMSPKLAAMIEEALAADDSAAAITEAAPPAKEPPPSPIRIFKPAPMPSPGQPLDAVQTAIRAVQEQPIAPPSPPTTRQSNRITPIGQQYVGELTGSITGEVHCFGYAIHDGVCVYVNMAGPRMGVEAIRAKLSKGDQVTVVPPDAASVELTAGEGNSGMYHPYLHYLPEARFASLILVHDWAVTPRYGGSATTFIFRTSDAQAIAKLKHHVMRLVKLPVFDAWSAYLYAAGQQAMLVRPTRSAGGIDLLTVDLDVDAWSRLITGGLEQGIIHLP